MNSEEILADANHLWKSFAGLMKRLQQDTLLSLIHILKVEFYESAVYGTPKDQRHVYLPDMKRVEIPLAERKKILIDEIGNELGRITHGVDLQAKIDKIFIYLRG